MIGKLPAAVLRESILSKTGASDERVQLGPRYGEDAAAIDIGPTTLVVSTDPLSLASEAVGTLGVHVACNDVAASGGTPAWLTNCLFLPQDDPDQLETIVEDIHRTAASIDVAIVGGHSEYAPDLTRPLLVLTAFGTTDRFIPTGGGQPGDRILLTRAAGIEGTAILASEFRSALIDHVDEEALERAGEFLSEIDVIPAAKALQSVATGLHDPTEGGVLTGLYEMAEATDRTFVVDREAIPIRSLTTRLCDVMEVDPLAIFGSGALLATVPAHSAEEAVEAVEATGTSATIIGRVEDGREGLVLDGQAVTTPPEDELYRFWQ